MKCKCADERNIQVEMLFNHSKSAQDKNQNKEIDINNVQKCEYKGCSAPAMYTIYYFGKPFFHYCEEHYIRVLFDLARYMTEYKHGDDYHAYLFLRAMIEILEKRYGSNNKKVQYMSFDDIKSQKGVLRYNDINEVLKITKEKIKRRKTAKSRV